MKDIPRDGYLSMCEFDSGAPITNRFHDELIDIQVRRPVEESYEDMLMHPFCLVWSQAEQMDRECELNVLYVDILATYFTIRILHLCK